MAKVWDKVRSALSSPGAARKTGPDEYPLRSDDPFADEHELISADFEQIIGGMHYSEVASDGAVSQVMAGREPVTSRRLVLALVLRISHIERNDGKIRNLLSKRRSDDAYADSTLLYYLRMLLHEPLKVLLRRKLPFETDDIVRLVRSTREAKFETLVWQPVGLIIKAAASHSGKGQIPVAVAEELTKFAARLRREDRKEYRDAAERIDKLLGEPVALTLHDGEAWSDQLLFDIGPTVPSKKDRWNGLLVHCQSASGSKPSSKWCRAAEDLRANIGEAEFKDCVCRWLPLVDKPRTRAIDEWPEWQPDPNRLIGDANAQVLKGLAWCCGLKEDKEIGQALSALALSAYKKVPGIGPRAVKVGNACVWALGNMPGMEGVWQLALLKIRIKFRTAQKLIDQSLTSAAKRCGIPREDLEEMAVPAYGLTDVGIRREKLGEYTAELFVTGTTSTQLRWIKPDGKAQKSVPAAINRDFADDLKELKQAAKDIQKMLPAQRERIDCLHLRQKSWTCNTWRERYLDHPLVGTLARRLIWTFKLGDGEKHAMFHDGNLVDHCDEPIEEPDDDVEISLWHPIGKSVEEITAWRRWLEEHEVVQPFKQAHREVYLPTDAERATRVYSNRFAAHILRQHQFNALCSARGWKNQLRLMVDDEYPPASLELPEWNLRAEFWIEGVGTEYGQDTNETGTYYHLVTDQVRFYRLGAAQRTAHAGGGGYHPTRYTGDEEPVPLNEIPPLVLSEVLRDVDLFVGVSSVGNDPTWADGGPQGRYVGYWADYSFGDLGESAKTRKDVLERLLPRLKIALHCDLTDRFLTVRGSLRNYKIHLGSGNILMEPNDQYLCIVQARGVAADSAGGRLHLPFEGDGMLSVILSKAFLLVDDMNIKDPTIVSQIRRR